MVLALLLVSQYYASGKNAGALNIFDVIIYQYFVVANFGAVIAGLTYLGYVSFFYVAVYVAAFSALLFGIYVGSRLKIAGTTARPGRTIFNPLYFYFFLAIGAALQGVALGLNIETWLMDGDAHLNRIDVYRNNSFVFFLTASLGFSLNVYFMLSIFLSKSNVHRCLAWIYLVVALAIGMTGASRSGMISFIFQASFVLFVLGVVSDRNSYKTFFSIFFKLLLFLFLTSLVIVSLAKGDERGLLFPIIERIVYSSDNVIYFHVFLDEGFAYPLNYSFQYFLHPILKPLGYGVIGGGIGASMSEALSGEMTGRGPVSSFIYDGLFIFGTYGMIAYSFLLGLFVGFVRKWVRAIVLTKVFLQNPGLFLLSTLLFSLCLVIISDLLTFVTYLVVAAPFIIFIWLLSCYLNSKRCAANV